MSRFATQQAEDLFGIFSDAAEGFQNSDVLEAAGVLLAQVVASGSYDIAGATLMVEKLGVAMIGDIARNWDAVMAQRQRVRQ